MKGGDVSFVISAGLGDPVAGLIRGAQHNELSCVPAGSCCVLCSPALVQRGVLWPQLCVLSSEVGIKTHMGTLSPWVAVLRC